MKLLTICVCALSMCNAYAITSQHESINIAALMSNSASSSEMKQTASKDLKETKQYLSDSEITAKVKETFVKEKLFGKEKISAMGIHVKTNKGIVTLTGKATSLEDAQNAIKLAKSVEGVKDVKSKIKVKTAKK
ncbi:MAG: BON domain-containing protein [Candidatus Berkiella sp.]